MKYLSICIPTFNRASFLKETLDSITSQEIFKNSNIVEVVISDNSSTDNTRELCLDYVQKYGEKIKYFRHEVNIEDKNFEFVLSRGKGEYLKLNNDTLVHKKNSLAFMLDVIKKNRVKKPLLFFSNGALSTEEFFIGFSIDNFISKVSFFSTWIGGFGIWKSDFKKIKDFNRFSNMKLVQTDVILRTLMIKKYFIVSDRVFAETIFGVVKGGYSFIDVFMDNYFQIIEFYVLNGNLSEDSYKKEKRKVLIKQVAFWHAKTILRRGSLYDFNGVFRKIIFHYKSDLISIFLYPLSVFFLMMHITLTKSNE
jgi:glycosyltransferase involved in cell wall biosynthesis